MSSDLKNRWKCAKSEKIVCSIGHMTIWELTEELNPSYRFLQSILTDNLQMRLWVQKLSDFFQICECFAEKRFLSVQNSPDSDPCVTLPKTKNCAKSKTFDTIPNVEMPMIEQLKAFPKKKKKKKINIGISVLHSRRIFWRRLI